MEQLLPKRLMQASAFFLFTFFFLSFSDLSAQSGIIQGRIYDANTNESLVGATVAVIGTSTGTVTDYNGNYRLEVEPGNYSLRVSFIGYKGLEDNVTVSAAGMVEKDYYLKPTDVNLSEVVVIGSRNTSRTVIESPVPVDVLPMESLLEVVPQVDVNQILTYVAPSFQSNPQTISDGTDHIDPASLRGLGPDQVLVLVNGKRRHNTALVNVNGTFGRGNVGTDLNTIPASAIERIEILRDGAAAQYGSDAIAGIINIVLKSNVDELTAIGSTGIYAEGDGERLQLSSNYGFKAGEKGFVNLTGEFSFRGHTNRMEEFEGAIFSSDGQSYSDGIRDDITDEEELARRGLSRSDFNMRVGNSEIMNTALFLNSSIPMGNQAEFYAFGGINYRKGEAAGFYRLPYQDRNIPEIYPNGFLPEIHSTILDRSVTLGLRGELKEWEVDLYNGFGINSFNFRVENSLNASLLESSPTSFNSGGFSFSQNVTGLSFSRYFPESFSGLNVAFGTEFRVDNYRIIAGEEASYRNYGLRTVFDPDTLENGSIYLTERTVDVLGRPGGAQVFPGFTPANELDRYRTNAAAYLDVEADFTDNFMLGAAARYENYSDFGGTLTGKLASRLKISEKVAVRGAISTGFRAPALHQLYFNTVSTLFIDGEPFEVGTFSNTSRAAQLLGIPKLKEETSMNYSFGITAQPSRSLDFSVDGYIIEIDDRIVLTGNFSGDASAAPGSQDREIFELLRTAGANQARFFTNAVSTTTKGLDVIATYRTELGQANFRATLAMNLNETEAGSDIRTSPLLAGKENIYFNREDRGRIELANPKSKINLTLGYELEKFRLMVRNVRFGEITALHPSDESGERDQTFSAKIVTDASLSYRVSPALDLSIGGNNIFDVYPDENIESERSDGRFLYSRRVTQFGFNGAFYFARAILKL